ncbi:hypothetical protein [Pedobacter endophyticus]|uniref:Uncharacterized protein n=1 Tax=Pedobacter endophyticus TaxID=2789740 RepID=A0A7S9L0C9_9SPHI|nr:hypothetical protein [Pedobacter endophyticus]QPH40122.1 hypothetical protein IZT61_02220 [Pedobacter endophyticus]
MPHKQTTGASEETNAQPSIARKTALQVLKAWSARSLRPRTPWYRWSTTLYYPFTMLVYLPEYVQHPIDHVGTRGRARSTPR